MEIYEDPIATFRSGATGRAEDFAAFSIVQARQTAREMAPGRGARVNTVPVGGVVKADAAMVVASAPLSHRLSFGRSLAQAT
jgi:hypothetical protein